jgi:hypothetical protein
VALHRDADSLGQLIHLDVLAVPLRTPWMDEHQDAFGRERGERVFERLGKLLSAVSPPAWMPSR